MAKGPPGRNFSWATPRCGRSWRATSTMATWPYDQARAPMPASSRMVPKRPSAEATRRVAMRRPLFSTSSARSGSRLVSTTSSGATSSTCGQAASRRSSAARKKRFSTIQPIGAAVSSSLAASRWSKWRNIGLGRPSWPASEMRMSRIGSASVGQLRPDAQRREQALAGVGDGGGPPVEACIRERLQRDAVDQDRVEAGLSCRQRQQAAVQAGAHDGKIEPIILHWRLMAVGRAARKPPAHRAVPGAAGLTH